MRGSIVVLGLLGALSGCAGSSANRYIDCPRDPATGMSQCMTTSSSPGDAAAVTGLAAGVYAFTGCTVNGCLLPDRCNTKTKRCEPIRCSETLSCPAGYKCQFASQLCR
jgi:hypothetical protein